MCFVAEPRAVDVRSGHQFEEEIGDASSENGLFIAKMDFSVRTPVKNWSKAYSGSIENGQFLVVPRQNSVHRYFQQLTSSFFQSMFPDQNSISVQREH
jgi:hypothetical protein